MYNNTKGLVKTEEKCGLSTYFETLVYVPFRGQRKRKYWNLDESIKNLGLNQMCLKLMFIPPTPMAFLLSVILTDTKKGVQEKPG